MLQPPASRASQPRLWRRWEWLSLPILALPIVWLYIEHGLPKGHDVPFHWLRSLMLDQYLSSGMGYPRWFPELALGYGYPLFNFYAPATFYLAWLWKLVVNDYQVALMCTLSLLMLIGGWGAWALAGDIFGEDKERFSRWQPLVAAVAYIYTPYLLTNIFVRGAIGEVGAQACLPWVLYGFRRVMRADRPARAVPLAAVTLALLAATHTVSLLLVPPFLVAYVVVLGRGRLRRLGWAAAACALAMGLSAFFWLPLIVERRYLAPTVVEITQQWMNANFWTLKNFISLGFFFNYTFTAPFQLGLVQILLALAGLVARRTRRAEWWFLAISAVLLSLLSFDFMRPFWFSRPELLAVQFTWRLMGLTGLSLALLAAGCVGLWRGRLGRAATGLMVIGLIIAAHRPTLMWTPAVVSQEYLALPPDDATLSLATVAQFENITGDIGLSSNAYGVNADFIPKWVNLYYGLRPHPGAAEMPPSDSIRAVTVEAASPFGLRLNYTAAQTATVRLTEFYFPGWQVRLDGHPAPAAYPTTPMGLMTLDLPSGTHRLDLEWTGTFLEQAATFISGLALLVLAAWLWRGLKAKWLATLPVAVLILGAGLFNMRPALTPVAAAPEGAQAAGLQLIGVRGEQHGAYLDLYPYWFVRAQAPDVEFWWQMLGADGQVLTETRTRPYFDTLPAYSWRTATLVDDAYRLALPPGLPAGHYPLRVCAVPFGSAQNCASWVSAGSLTLRASAAPAAPTLTPLTLQVGDELKLAGYTLSRNQTPIKLGAAAPVVRPGEILNVTLYWQAQRLISENYHSYVHLDGTGAGFDHGLGPLYYPPRLWDTVYPKPDVYSLDLPRDTPSGLYRLTTGVYHFEGLKSLPIASADGQPLGDSYTLLSLKVLNPPAAPPRHTLNARIEGLGNVVGYNLAPETAVLRPGDTLTVTVYFKAQAAAPADYSRFIHLYSAENGLVAQADSQPQSGVNPTSAWLPGEVIADTGVLTVSPDAPAGRYALLVGLYDPQAGGERLPAFGAGGEPLPNNAVPLTELTVGR